MEKALYGGTTDVNTIVFTFITFRAVGMETIACSADLSWPTSQLGNLVPFGANDTTGKNVTSTSSIEHPGRSGGPGVVPLRLTHLVRDLTLPDVTGCCFELHSSDGRRSCLLRAPDAQEARMWFDAIHSKMKIINKSYLAELNRLLPPTQVSHNSYFIKIVIYFTK